MDAILVVNAGSSSLKFQVFATGASGDLDCLVKGQMDGIGTRPRLRAAGPDKKPLIDQSYPVEKVPDLPAATQETGDWLRKTQKVNLVAVGHRVVHGGPEYSRPVRLTADVVAKLERYVSLAPLHQPNNLAPIRTLFARRPELPQVACFDTAFHRDHGALADHFAIPEKFYEEGVRRYGFHGLSYEYIADRLRQIAPEAAKGRVIVAHLGSGASMCALADGRSVESTFGFTALDGLPMGTRPGQLDPGVVLYLIAEKGMTAAAVQDLFYKEFGLEGSFRCEQRRARTRGERRSESGLCSRVLRLSRRSICGDACCRAARDRCLRFHRRYRRKFRDDTCAYLRAAVVAGGLA